MTTNAHFLTPLLDELTAFNTDFAARVNAAVSAAQTNIFAELAGIVSAVSQPGKVGLAAKPTAKGGKRSPEDLAAMVELVFDAIKKSPGERIEALAKKYGFETRDMRLPIQKLREAKRITTKGQRRATTYRVKG